MGSHINDSGRYLAKVNRHKGSNYFSFICRYCNSILMGGIAESLKRLIYGNKNKIKCQLCDRTFATRS